jgi:4-amino-4-deoxy-L-arabinose transferase-like glycosyltransferase
LSDEPDARESGLERPAIAILILALLLIGSSGWIGLIEPTETRYAEIAREMLARGDWVTPRLNGIHHFHKPPIAYWGAAAGMALLGVNAWGARLFALLADVVTIALAAWIAARRFKALAIAPGRAAWVLGSMLLFAVVGRGLATDPFLAATVTLYWALAPSPLALAAVGIGFMTKGPVVFLHTALPVLGAALWARDRRFLALLGPARGWIVFAAIALPWYLIVVVLDKGLLGYFLGNQVVARVATETHGRGGPPWYFLAVILAGSAPWTMALLVGIARTWKQRSDPEARLVLAWLVAPIVFLSFSGSKLPSYLLPCLPAAALLAVRGIDSSLARWGAAVTLVLLGFSLWFQLTEITAPLGSVSTAGLAACIVLVLGGVVAGAGRPVFAALATTMALATLAIALAPFEGALESPRPIARQLAGLRDGEPVVEIGHFNAGLPFYLGQTVRLLEVPREKGFEDPASLAAVVVPRDSLPVWARRHGKVWVFGPEERSRSVAAATGLDYEATARWRKEALGSLSRRRKGVAPPP